MGGSLAPAGRSVVSVALALSAALCGAGCGEGETDGPDTDSGVTDVRVAMPVMDPNFIDLAGGEAVIQPGEEKLWCSHLHYDGPDAAFDLQQTMQGQFGHHAVLLGAVKALDPGDGEDCTHTDQVGQYEAFSIGEQELPAGYGVFLASGRSLVLQSHYINVSSEPILIRDVVRLRKVPLAEVKSWASVYATTHMGFSLPAGEASVVQFDCAVEKDVELLLAGGHMHENGTAIEVLYGPDSNALATLLRTDPWLAEYRDFPPMERYEEPLVLLKGTLLRTRCELENRTGHELTYPEEMCLSFGYAAGTKEPVVCAVF